VTLAIICQKEWNIVAVTAGKSYRVLGKRKGVDLRPLTVRLKLSAGWLFSATTCLNSSGKSLVNKLFSATYPFNFTLLQGAKPL